MSLRFTRSAIVRLGLSMSLAAAALSVAEVALGARPTGTIPAAVGASAPPGRVSPYTLANRRHAAAAAASSAAGLPTLPASIRHGRQGPGRAPAPGVVGGAST